MTEDIQKEELYCSVPWCYTITKDEAITVRYFIIMKGEVDGEALRRAVDMAMKRYPYLAKELVVAKDRYYYIPNDRPVVVKHTINPITLGGKDANYHQLALSWFKNVIVFNNTHAIFDGRGRGPLLHTIIYYYCTYRYNESQQMSGVNLADSPIDPAEYYDPYATDLPKKQFDIPVFSTPKNILRLDKMGYVDVEEPQLHVFRVPEKQLMSICKSADATPNTAVTLLMCRAIKKVHPYTELPIVPGVYCDLRSALQAQKSHYSLVSVLDLVFDEQISKLPFEEQNTIFRGKMMLMSDPSYLLDRIRIEKEGAMMIKSLPTLEQKNEISCKAMNSLFLSHTFFVSYSGKSNFGSCDKYILGTSPQPYAHNLGMLLEITASDGWFDITLAQEWSIDVYFDAFLKELTSCGIDYELLLSRKISHCPYELPPVKE